MNESKDRIIDFIESENAFQVMAELKRHGALTKEDIAKAMSLSREDWLDMMKKAAGVGESEED